MEKKLISVIVPIYNVAAYLHQCLDSVYVQYNPATMEVILVNDGSTDESLSICKEYKNRYPDTILIDRQKEEPGPSSARNAGTEVAVGEYICYLDGDDWLAPNALQQLYRFAEENQCEMVQGGFYYAYADHLLYDNYYSKREQPIMLTKEEAMKALIENIHIKNFCWGKLYKTEIVKKHKFKKGLFFQDIFWHHRVMNDVMKYGITPEPLYYYRQRKESTTGHFSIKQLDLLTGCEDRWNFVCSNYKDLKADMGRMFFFTICDCYLISLKYPDLESQYRQKKDMLISKYWDDFKSVMSNTLYNRIYFHLFNHWFGGFRIFLFINKFIKKLTLFKTNTFTYIKL
ncbi:MAG: glycosyltransferase [Prevotella sp.]|nr:glycosyltransferase [Prevotella sp.]